MSKNFLKDQIREKQRGNFYFAAIKSEWARASAQQAIEHRWSKNINPSSGWLTWSGCPYEGIREAAQNREAHEAESIQYMEVGNYLHKMFQDRSLEIEDLLWPKIGFVTTKEKEKLDKHWPEVPFFWPEFDVSGRIDSILNFRGEPCVIDIKCPQRPDASWEKYIEKLPEETHLTQSAVGALALEEMGLLKPTRVGVVYFNPCITPKGGKGFKECYELFTQEMKDKTRLLLTHAKKEKDLFLSNKESSCTYPLCKKHGQK